MPCGRCRALLGRHPILATIALGVFGLACILIPVGAIFGIFAFLRTM